MKKRMQIVAGLTLVLAFSSPLDAQTVKRLPRIGFVVSAGNDSSSKALTAFKAGLRGLRLILLPRDTCKASHIRVVT
jgi:hypothetical protein